MAIEEHEQKIREIATKEYGIEPGYAEALYLHRYSDGWQAEAIGLGGVTQARLQEFIAWFHKNHRDRLPPL